MITAVAIHHVNIPQLVHALAIIESSNRDVAPYWDRHQKSWGIFACGQTRWVECGGMASEWGVAGPVRQYQVVTNGIEHKLRTLPRCSLDEQVLRIAIWWNGCKMHDSYARRLLKLYHEQEHR